MATNASTEDTKAHLPCYPSLLRSLLRRAGTSVLYSCCRLPHTHKLYIYEHECTSVRTRKG